MQEGLCKRANKLSLPQVSSLIKREVGKLCGQGCRPLGQIQHIFTRAAPPNGDLRKWNCQETAHNSARKSKEMSNEISDFFENSLEW